MFARFCATNPFTPKARDSYLELPLPRDDAEDRSAKDHSDDSEPDDSADDDDASSQGEDQDLNASQGEDQDLQADEDVSSQEDEDASQGEDQGSQEDEDDAQADYDGGDGGQDSPRVVLAQLVILESPATSVQQQDVKVPVRQEDEPKSGDASVIKEDIAVNGISDEDAANFMPDEQEHEAKSGGDSVIKEDVAVNGISDEDAANFMPDELEHEPKSGGDSVIKEDCIAVNGISDEDAANFMPDELEHEPKSDVSETKQEATDAAEKENIRGFSLRVHNYVKNRTLMNQPFCTFIKVMSTHGNNIPVDDRTIARQCAALHPNNEWDNAKIIPTFLNWSLVHNYYRIAKAHHGNKISMRTDSEGLRHVISNVLEEYARELNRREEESKQEAESDESTESDTESEAESDYEEPQAKKRKAARLLGGREVKRGKAEAAAQRPKPAAKRGAGKKAEAAENPKPAVKRGAGKKAKRIKVNPNLSLSKYEVEDFIRSRLVAGAKQVSTDEIRDHYTTNTDQKIRSAYCNLHVQIKKGDCTDLVAWKEGKILVFAAKK